MKLSIEPRFAFGWNSAKYDQITGPLPPSLQKKKKQQLFIISVIHQLNLT